MDYNFLLDTKSSRQWNKIGTDRRSGVAVPVFSLLSKKSTGIGEFYDLKFFADWCKSCGFSIVQLLPVNDLGFDFSPYNSVSSFALEPAYLSLSQLKNVSKWKYGKEIRRLRKLFSGDSERIDYNVKNEKLKVLRKIFEAEGKRNNEKLGLFVEKNKFWLRDYALYKVLKEKQNGKSWEDWEEKYKNRDISVLGEFMDRNSNEIKFRYWLQWQLFEQFKETKKVLTDKGLLLFGDIPFLVSRDSADVWANQNYFKLDFSAGAPPDMYFANGQRWGMPPYRWDEIEKDGYTYLKKKLKYAGNFFDMFRIDHFVGLLRVWSIAAGAPPETGGLYGKFDPEDENNWEEHAKKILDVMLESTDMLPCAEDLGTIPPASYKVLEEYGILGIDVQRWKKNWGGSNEYITPGDYRKNAIATVSTHDSSFLPVWWKYEAGSIDEILFKRICEKLNINEETYHNIFEKLFDNDKNNYGRLFWKKDVVNVDYLISILGRSRDDAYEIVNLFLESFGEKQNFLQNPETENPDSPDITADFVEKCLWRIHDSASVFSINLLYEYLFLDTNILNRHSDWNYRLNFPGKISKLNWSLKLPVKLEELKKSNITSKIKEINTKTGRFFKFKI